MTFETTVPRILFIDSYDSFTFNLVSLCREAIPDCAVHIIKNDAFTIEQLLPFLPLFSAVVVGPGPGSPQNDQDIGVIKDLWGLAANVLLPIFGVCLGLQSLGVAYGARLERLNVVKHGQASLIHHTGRELFEGVGLVEAVRYHSLHVTLLDAGEVEQLAWADDGSENGLVVMAMRHTSKPFWAVQYHPESVCTQGGGRDVVSNFWSLAQTWSNKHGRRTLPWNSSASSTFGNPWPVFSPTDVIVSPSAQSQIVSTRILDLPNLTARQVCELFGVANDESPFVLLDSAAQPGRHSIIGSLLPSSPQLSYFVGDAYVTLTQHGHCSEQPLEDRDIWSWVSHFVMSKGDYRGHPEIPFWGGLVGLLSYEIGVDTLTVPLRQNRTRRHPDLNLVFVERSVVLGAGTGQVFVQSLLANDEDWVANTAAALLKADSANFVPRSKLPEIQPTLSIPNKAQYISRILEAQESISSGDSYELCLTARTTANFQSAGRPPGSRSWNRYQALRSKNPAPYSAYIRLHPTTFLSSSPERFISTSRPPRSVFQMRPIKGTVRKAPGITRAVAEAALAGSVKEVAENLMIVDLIRHDLHSVLGEDVQVKQFCKVEEYETVWQLVSVIEGKLDPRQCGRRLEQTLGWDTLKRSLPPGSMTGAPKKRSVEILRGLEDTERNIYSGVFGYWCVGGGSDWSVTIRSCFHFDDPSCPDEIWEMGAGGAITALSDADDEWDEMLVKLTSVARSFTTL